MKIIKTLTAASLLTLTLAGAQTAYAHGDKEHATKMNQLSAAIAGDHRSDKNKARDMYRHPKETLEFFGFHSAMTVVEITPGGGWYTEILAPALKGKGKLYGAQYPDTGEDNYFSKSRKNLEKKLASNAVFSEVELTDFVPRKESTLAPAGTADLVLTFRNLHNWKDAGVEQVFKDAYKALKAGGVLGVVEHRLPEGSDPEKSRGYVSQSKTIAQAKAAGFKLAAKSEINANPKDLAQYKVWTLPPALANGEKDKEKYLAIGESDRMTLKFVKPKK
ncbi:class I SAM-dependent methyltransferase [Thalassotalea atypica]|uniref:class I SAM-dependent methyltransferase n=1 Tax=Thalassotalea atypica TaxID=2054316 RepID=UPI0025726BE5|nr:methyltransferase [Thalassotalea atypica]